MPVSKRVGLPTWIDFVNRWKDCTACPLCEQRDCIVLARGAVPCDVLFVGEAPGEVEDTRGLPFQGPAGQLLDKIVAAALPPEVTYAMTNIVCCFPREAKLRGDHEPQRAEILACRPRLIEFVNLAQPRLIVCVGALATEYVYHSDDVPCINIVHPAYILAHMPRVQKDYAVQKSIVQIRTAVDKMLDAPQKPFTKWGTDAYISQGRGLKQRLDAFTQSDDNIPY